MSSCENCDRKMLSLGAYYWCSQCGKREAKE